MKERPQIVGSADEQRALDAVIAAAIKQAEADGDLAQTVLAALAAGVPAARIAREAGLPYSRVLKWRRYV